MTVKEKIQIQKEQEKFTETKLIPLASEIVNMIKLYKLNHLQTEILMRELRKQIEENTILS